MSMRTVDQQNADIDIAAAARAWAAAVRSADSHRKAGRPVVPVQHDYAKCWSLRVEIADPHSYTGWRKVGCPECDAESVRQNAWDLEQRRLSRAANRAVKRLATLCL